MACCSRSGAPAHWQITRLRCLSPSGRASLFPHPMPPCPPSSLISGLSLWLVLLPGTLSFSFFLHLHPAVFSLANSFSFSKSVQLNVYHFYLFSQRTNFWFNWFFSIIFLSSILFISALFFVIAFLLFILHLICSSFSSFLRWSFRRF